MTIFFIIVLLIAGRLLAVAYLRKNSERSWSDSKARYIRRYHLTKGNLVSLIVIVGPALYAAHAVVVWVQTYLATIVLVVVLAGILLRAVRRAWRQTRVNIALGNRASRSLP